MFRQKEDGVYKYCPLCQQGYFAGIGHYDCWVLKNFPEEIRGKKEEGGNQPPDNYRLKYGKCLC